jgi:ketosteroid isomerase-like protein
VRKTVKYICKFCIPVLSLAIAACSTAKSGPVAAERPPKSEAKAQGRDTFKTADQFDPMDVAAIHKLRDEWISAFTSGIIRPIEFMFTNDALFTLPPELLSQRTGAADAQHLFKKFNAQLLFDEKSEQFVTDGGDPRKMSRLPWVSYYAAYKLTLSPKEGGQPLQTNGRFMTRFRRQADGSLKVMRGFSIGQRTLDFTLNLMKSDDQIQLSALRGKPTVVIFGSYT